MAWTSARVAATDAGAPARPAVPVGAVANPGDVATTAAVAEPAASELGAPEGSPATTRDPPGSSDSSPRPSALLLSAAIGIPFSVATVFSNVVFSTIVVIISPDLHVRCPRNGRRLVCHAEDGSPHISLKERRTKASHPRAATIAKYYIDIHKSIYRYISMYHADLSISPTGNSGSCAAPSATWGISCAAR